MADDSKGIGAADIVTAVERFFLDLIGTVIPGTLLLGGWLLVFGTPKIAEIHQLKEDYLLVTLLVGGYVLGHLVASIGFSVTLPLAEKLARLMRLLRVSFLVTFIHTGKERDEKVIASAIYKSFVNRARLRFGWLASVPTKKTHEWRNIAMSLLTPEENHTIYRFTFISLLNLGVASVGSGLIIVWLAVRAVELAPLTGVAGSLLFPSTRPLDVGVVAITLVITYFALERQYTFGDMAFKTPFAMAAVKLDASTARECKVPDRVPAGKPVIYLAGGFRSGWQRNVLDALPDYRLIDPRAHGLQNEDRYTAWDLEGIRQSDWVLAYLEESNPGGYSLALEVGYAKALGKRIVFVDEKSSIDTRSQRYLAMVRVCADFTTASLHEAIDFFKILPRKDMTDNV